MRVGVIQSNYIPWYGYFDFIKSVDLFIFHDDIQYTKGDWRNRNKIKTPTGSQWLTVPVHYNHTDQLICETEISYLEDWQREHLNRFTASYHEAKNFKDAIDILRFSFGFRDRTISSLNQRLTRMICFHLGIKTLMMDTGMFNLQGSKTERLINLLRQCGATTYLSGPAGKNYLDENLFKEAGIELEYKTYDYPPYNQLHGTFDPYVTVLDKIANT